MSEEAASKLLAEINDIKNQLTKICTKLEERQRRCESHADGMDEYEIRLRAIEIWQAAQSGSSGLAWRVMPLLISALSVGVAAYAVAHR